MRYTVEGMRGKGWVVADEMGGWWMRYTKEGVVVWDEVYGEGEGMGGVG